MARDALLAMTMFEVFFTARRLTADVAVHLPVGAAKDHSRHFLSALGTGSPRYARDDKGEMKYTDEGLVICTTSSPTTTSLRGG